ncbi:unnamed protein product [Linum tenue]|uniref:Methylenetetrahydrofolate reductase n=1 Tax=Linum tenue TaxID=586396 RepID=A0AAV0Q8B7_9ROSI|nr:unnamed protein product [Linum tenue]
MVKLPDEKNRHSSVVVSPGVICLALGLLKGEADEDLRSPLPTPVFTPLYKKSHSISPYLHSIPFSNFLICDLSPSLSPPQFPGPPSLLSLLVCFPGKRAMKVIDKIRSAVGDGTAAANGSNNTNVVFSFEFFPPKTEDGVENLFERMDRMVAYNPTFCDITWGAGGSTADVTLNIANRMQNSICVETMMHLTCTNMPVEKIDHALGTIKSNGIQNVLALRGDPPHGQDKFVQVQGGFACALDLVKHIRSKYGDYFGITVAGYPETHPDVIGSDGLATPEAYRKDLAYLKQKVDAGADLIVTQLFYDTDIFLKFVNDCRQIGITCPIVPGIMPINNYKGFLRMTGFCKTKIPAEIMAALEPIKDNEEAVRAYGIHLGTEMCKKIIAHGIKTVHLYTLNMEKSALGILMSLGLIEESKISRSLPWRRPANVFRVKEEVRPIFWANRPKSYISRTVGWDQYPHGRWGDSGNPSYGGLSDHQVQTIIWCFECYRIVIYITVRTGSKVNFNLHGVFNFYYTRPLNIFVAKSEQDRNASRTSKFLSLCPFMRPRARDKKLHQEWAVQLNSVDDIYERFKSFCLGTLKTSPWSELDGLQPETKVINEKLGKINSKGILTINSQPAVNGEKSDSPTVGWGGPGGYVYQKAYLEFFCSKEKLDALVGKWKATPQLTYIAVNKSGNSISNVKNGSVNAVTWGVFPAKEILQPTVVDPTSFGVWKDEAFEIWSRGWASLYPEDDPSRKLLKEVESSYYLVSLVDNNYVNGDIFAAFADL